MGKVSSAARRMRSTGRASRGPYDIIDFVFVEYSPINRRLEGDVWRSMTAATRTFSDKPEFEKFQIAAEGGLGSLLRELSASEAKLTEGVNNVEFC